MKKYFRYFLVFVLLFQLPILAVEKCDFTYVPSQTVLEWTAFKFTEKMGVKGLFEIINVSGTKKANSVLDSVKDLKFVIKTDSINSNNPDRDAKIKKYFFGSVKNSKEIHGNFSNVIGTSSGTASLNLEFNKIKTVIPVKFDTKEDKIEVSGKIDVISLGLSAGLAKLNQECNDLHKGKDGLSKLWTTVDFKITSQLSKKCDP